MPQNIAKIFTTTITGIFDVPDGATEVFMNNIGAGNATWTGNTKNSDDAPSTSVILKPNTAFSYGFIGRTRKGFKIDATGTSVEISITF